MAGGSHDLFDGEMGELGDLPAVAGIGDSLATNPIVHGRRTDVHVEGERALRKTLGPHHIGQEFGDGHLCHEHGRSIGRFSLFAAKGYCTSPDEVLAFGNGNTEMGMATTETGTGTMQAGEILRELARRKRSVSWLSREVGISVSHLHRVLVTGERALSDDLARRIEEAFRADAQSYAGGVR